MIPGRVLHAPYTRARAPYPHADAETISGWVGPEHADAVFYANVTRVYLR